MTLLKLFWSFFQIGLFSIGGGYASMPLIQEQVVELHHWLSMTDFVDVVTISQMTPGPIAINAATFVGMRIAQLPGAIVATFGCVAPSCIIVLAIGYFYLKYKNLLVVDGALTALRPAVVSMIASAGLSILLSSLAQNRTDSWLALRLQHIDWVAVVLFLTGFLILRKWKINPIFVMLGSGGVGLVAYLLTGGG